MCRIGGKAARVGASRLNDLRAWNFQPKIILRAPFSSAGDRLQSGRAELPCRLLSLALGDVVPHINNQPSGQLWES
jgi:hypothetical protein